MDNLWLVGFIFTLAYMDWDDAKKYKDGKKVLWYIMYIFFAFIVWPLVLGLHIRSDIQSLQEKIENGRKDG
jgi:hypothetical protein